MPDHDFNTVLLSAMADELGQQHEKVAINMAAIGNALGHVGAPIIQGVSSAAQKLAPTVAAHAPGVGSFLSNMPGHIMQAGNAVGGGARLSQLVGGAALGAGTLAAGGVASRMMGGGQR